MTRGGKREGSGRKPVDDAGPGVRVSYRVPPDVAEKVKSLAADKGVSQGAIVAEAVRAIAPDQPPAP